MNTEERRQPTNDTMRMILIALGVALLVAILVPALFMLAMMTAMMGGGMMGSFVTGGMMSAGPAWVMLALVLLVLIAGGALVAAGVRR